MTRRLPDRLISTLLASAMATFTTTLPVHAADPSPLQAQLEQLAESVKPGKLGIAVIDLQSAATYGVNADQPFPMMSDFKAAVAATVLARIDDGSMTLNQRVVVRPEDFLDGSARPSLGARIHGSPIAVTLAEVLHAAVTDSDNTAVEVLLLQLGGASAVQGFLDRHAVNGVRISTGERGIAVILDNLGGTVGPGPAGETPQQQSRRLSEGYRNFLAAPPNQTTPAGGALFMQRLYQGEMLSATSTRYLLSLMRDQPQRLRGGVPNGVQFYDKTGTGVTVNGSIAAFNDMALISWSRNRSVAVAAYLTNSNLTEDQREKLFASITRDVATSLHY
jgi:beta-lactamase class A